MDIRYSAWHANDLAVEKLVARATRFYHDARVFDVRDNPIPPGALPYKRLQSAPAVESLSYIRPAYRDLLI